MLAINLSGVYARYLNDPKASRIFQDAFQSGQR